MLGGIILSGTLYVVATPIGNLDEITPRSLQILSEVDIIAAEDTRTTGLLFNRLGIEAKATKFISYHKFNESAKQNTLLEKLQAGQSIALVSDAGTPCISDPGYMLVKAAADMEIPIIGVSGSCAVILALSVSGFPAEPFLFLGFLPRKTPAIVEVMSLLLRVPTLIFYESPKRIADTVEILANHFPNIFLCLCNDLTKKFERIYRGTPTEVLENLHDNPNAEKGEYTCLVFMPPLSKNVLSDENSVENQPSLESLLIDVMVKSNCSMKDAIKILSSNQKSNNQLNFQSSHSISYTKNEIYTASLRLKELFS